MTAKSDNRGRTIPKKGYFRHRHAETRCHVISYVGYAITHKQRQNVLERVTARLTGNTNNCSPCRKKVRNCP